MFFQQMAVEKEIYDIEYEKANTCKNLLSSYQEDWVECKEDEVRIGDIIYAEYYSDSQKYFYTHSPEYGTVENIDKEEYYSPDSEFPKKERSITILNHNGELVKINKEHLSIYSRGYCIYIKKYRRKHKHLTKPFDDGMCVICSDYHDDSYTN